MVEVTLKDNFKVTVGGEPRHIKMKYGLLNELVRTVGDIEGVAEIGFDTDLRNALLTELLSERDEEGVITKKINVFTLDVEPDDVIDLLDWAGEHVTDFLLKQMIRSKKLMEANQPRIAALMPTSAGSQT